MDIPESIHELILDELNGSIDESGNRQLKEWIEASSENHSAWTEYCTLWYSGLTGERKKHENTDTRWNAIIQHRRHKQNKRRMRYLISAAASVLLFCSLFFIFRHSRSDLRENATIADLTAGWNSGKARLILPSGSSLELDRQISKDAEGIFIHADSLGLTYREDKKNENKTVWHELVVPKGGEYRLTLADGTSVMLNSASSIRFPLPFSAHSREVRISGEAYFRVARDEERPFTVHTDHTATRVLGTEFNIMAYPNDPTTEITLVRGSVNVGINGHSEPLSPGYQVVVDNISLESCKQEVDTDLITSWQSGTIRFDDIPLEQLMKRLERWYDISFEFKEEKLKHKLFTGGFRKYENLEKVLNMIGKVNDIRFNVKNNIIIINSK